MTVDIQKAPIESKEKLFDLLQEYFAELTQYNPIPQDASGHYSYPYWDQYWTDTTRIPLMISLNETVIGFALVNNFVVDKYFNANYSIAEFYIRPDYRKQGFGKQFIFGIFAQFPGKWEVRQIAQNLTSQLFWRSVIGEYTDGNFQETILEYNEEKMVVQLFEAGNGK